MDPLLTSNVMECKEDLCILVCASAKALTLHPAEERLSSTEKSLGSHRRLDLASQFATTKITSIGLQETRLREARAVGIGHYLMSQCLRQQQMQRAKGALNCGFTLPGLLNLRRSLSSLPHIGSFAVRVRTIVGVLQLVVAHALVSSSFTLCLSQSN